MNALHKCDASYYHHLDHYRIGNREHTNDTIKLQNTNKKKARATETAEEEKKRKHFTFAFVLITVHRDQLCRRNFFGGIKIREIETGPLIITKQIQRIRPKIET